MGGGVTFSGAISPRAAVLKGGGYTFRGDFLRAAFSKGGGGGGGGYIFKKVSSIKQIDNFSKTESLL